MQSKSEDTSSLSGPGQEAQALLLPFTQGTLPLVLFHQEDPGLLLLASRAPDQVETRKNTDLEPEEVNLSLIYSFFFQIFMARPQYTGPCARGCNLGLAGSQMGSALMEPPFQGAGSPPHTLSVPP